MKARIEHAGKALRHPLRLMLPSMPVLIVVLLCFALAAQLGAFQQEFAFQKTPTDKGRHAFASGGSMLFLAPHENLTLSAAFEGRGHAGEFSYSIAGEGLEVASVVFGKEVACSPCEQGRKYPISAYGKLDVAITVQRAPFVIEKRDGFFRRVFFESNARTNVDYPVLFKIGGGWQAAPNSAIPSSFYGTDAPFHIHRVPIAADGILRLQVPYAEYTYLSVLPAAAIYLALGSSHQFAYKLWEILLLFVPVAVFYLFSRKLSSGRDGVFLFSSLLYLFLPSQGMLTGGGADLFIYGMTAHTLATSLSLLFLLFAYEYSIEKKNRRFYLAVLLFALAVASNQRIGLSLGIYLVALAAFSLVLSDPRRVALLGIACIAAGAWLVAPLLARENFVGGYSVLGGAASESLLSSIMGFFQLGYYVLPLLFIAGVARAIRGKEPFLVFLFASCAMVFALATNQEVNRIAPFLDGLRFMPSFFLPVFFLSGVGALFSFKLLLELAEKARVRLGLDRLDGSVSFALAVLLPFAALFASLAIATVEQYAWQANSLEIASIYSGEQEAYSIAGRGCVVHLGWNGVSSYPIFENELGRTVMAGNGDPDQMSEIMEGRGCHHLMIGGMKSIATEGGPGAFDGYMAFKKDSRFEEIEYGGTPRLFLLKKAENMGDFEPASQGEPPEWLAQLFAACAAVVLACGYLAGKLGAMQK